MKNNKAKFLSRVGVLTAIAFVLMYLQFPIAMLFPAFLQFDFSEVPALLGTFSLGPLAGVVIVFLKNVLVYLIRGSFTGGVGELSNFIISAAWMIPVGLIYKKSKTKKNAIKGMVVGGLAMIVVAALSNYFVIIPLYAKIMPIEAIIGMGAAINPAISNVEMLILLGVTPFNIFKVTIVSLVTALVYKKVSPVLHR
ncbi:ECF transporter S component [Alkalibacter rhizosphaerae]|uniref:Riboflavin transporter n=1 Tax=Alkalibacter rhizosphaerae TaxID=2815577 RepID=A0A974XDT7_9FIRM|nr:ECF transporter S component [Alkalibacter rhizosphaerae]QSX08007.1 ECF transporter S component [Alkalibacter rhizosphaerae]